MKIKHLNLDKSMDRKLLGMHRPKTVALRTLGGTTSKMRPLITTFLAAAALAVIQPSANAALTLYLSDGANAVLVTDNQAGDENPALGAVSYSKALSATSPWQILTITAGVSKPVTVNPQGDMHLSSFQTSISGPADLTVILADNGWPGALSGETASLNFGGAAAGTATGQALVQNNGDLPTLANPTPAGSLLIADTGPLGPGAFSANISGFTGAPLNDGFTLIQRVFIHHNGAGTSSIDYAISIPEPASLTLLGAALVLSSSLLRKKVSRP